MTAQLFVGRIAAIFVAALGVVHAIVNTIGFAQAEFQGWVEYLIFGVGLTLVALALAVVAWWLSGSRRAPWPGLVFIGIGGILLVLQVIGIAVVDPALLVRPLGPGPWSMIGGPALVVEAVILAVRRIAASDQDARAADLME